MCSASFVLHGYSERGMMNAICYDIAHSSDPLSRLKGFLSQSQFRQGGETPTLEGIQEARVIVEQSFSKFGTLDVLILLDHLGGNKQAFLVEAKVATDISRPKSISKRWNDFHDFNRGNEKHRSSLFVQLYRKVRLLEHLVRLDGDVDRSGDLGDNRVVLKAARLLAEYREKAWYIALVPDSHDTTSHFFNTVLHPYRPDPGHLPGWNTSRWGYITWADLVTYCGSEPTNWQRTLDTFRYNEGQIYKVYGVAGTNTGSSPSTGKVYEWRGQTVLMVWDGSDNCRVVPVGTGGVLFPRSRLVAKTELKPPEDSRAQLPHDHLQPQKGAIHRWDPPPGEQKQPRKKEVLPVSPTVVRVENPGWKESAVREVDINGTEFGHKFHVFTHHLKRNQEPFGERA
jgi:hypothetical protein